MRGWNRGTLLRGDSENLQNAFELVVAVKRNLQRAFAFLVLQLNFGSKPLAQPVLEIGHVRVLRQRRRRAGLRRMAPALLELGDQSLGLPDVESFFDHALRGELL